MREIYFADETARLDLYARDIDDALFDPFGVALIARDPEATVSEYVYGEDAIIVREGEGHYRAYLPLPIAGVWRWRWEITGSEGEVAAWEGFIDVEASRVA